MTQSYFDIHEATHATSLRKDFGWHLKYFESLDSTNSQAKANAAELEYPSLILAGHQTAGRGRGENVWEDEPKQCFLSTWSLDLMGHAIHPSVTLAIGLYAYEALNEAFPVRFCLKAPNDICIAEKKVGGIMVESSTDGNTNYLHIGLGLNVFAYPANYGSTATHLSAFLGSESLNAETWGDFLVYFGSAIKNLEGRIGPDHGKWLAKLSPRLVSALNRHPEHLKNPVKHITPDGSLTLESGTLNWQNI